MCLLTAICETLSQKDNRFKIAFKKLSKDTKKMNTPPKNETDSFLIKKWGEESSLKKLGVSVRVFPLKKDGKLQPLKEVFKTNEWIKCRALFGSNTRSDCAFIIASNEALLSASQVAKRAFSTRQAVSLYYKDLILLKNTFNLAG